MQTIASDVKHNIALPTGDNLYNRGAKTRAIAGLSFNVVEDVKANLLFQYVYNWGDHNYTNNGFDNAKGMYLANANLVFSNLFGALEVTIGRQFYGDENSAVMYFGPNHYNAEGLGYARALDAAKLVYSNDTWTATVIGGKIADWTFNEPDFYDDYAVTMFGADVRANLTDPLNVQAYAYDFKGREGFMYLTDGNQQGFYGAKLNFAPEGFRMSAEYARNMAGDRVFKEYTHTGYMVKADVATDFEAVTLRGTFLYSFRFRGYGNYTPGLLMHPFFVQNRWTCENVFHYGGTQGVRLFNVGIDFRPADQWTLSLDGYSFQGRAGHHAATLEADLTAKYDYNDNVQLFAGVGYAKYGSNGTFWSDPYDEMFGPDNTKVQLGTIVRF